MYLWSFEALLLTISLNLYCIRLFIFSLIIIGLEEFFLYSSPLSYVCIMKIFFQWLTFSTF